jgi:nucleoside 2-deoxyribosyltransferase
MMLNFLPKANMYYHGILDLGGVKNYWWNYTKDGMIAEILVPFVNGQTVSTNMNGETALLNMRNASFLNIYRTAETLEKSASGTIPNILLEGGKNATNCTKELINEVRQLQATPQLSSLLQKVFAKPKDQAFVIMKFGDKHLDSAYEGVIRPVVKKFGLSTLRIDELQDAGKITDQILEEIASSRVVIADLSGARPNCYYETGFAHALGKELILMINKEDAVHFDLAGHRFIQWDTEASLRSALRLRLKTLKAGKY